MKNKINNDPKFEAIIQSLCYWLGYQFKIGRENLIHEASFRYPVADTLTARTEISIHHIQLEFIHPCFKWRRIDLALFDENSKVIPKEIFEFKIAKQEIDTNSGSIASNQSIFDDMVRLAYFSKAFTETSCFLMVCGEFDDFKTYFIGDVLNLVNENNRTIIPLEEAKIIRSEEKTEGKQNKTLLDIFTESWNPKGTYDKWFGFKVNEQKENTFIKSKEEPYLDNFQTEYKLKDSFKHFDSLKIRTTCMAISSSSDYDRTHAAGIWKIEYVSEL